MSISTGSLTFLPNPQKTSTQIINAPNGGRFIWQYARAQLTSTLQNAIPLLVPYVKPNTQLSQYPDIPLQLPVGAQIQRVDFRLPRTPTLGDASIYEIDLPKGCTIIGTTGENLKVSPTSGTTHTVVAPVITCASSSYTPNASAVLQRQSGQADQSSPSLIQTVSGSAMTLQITVSNAGNSAAGNGIALSLSGALAYIYASIIYRIDGDAIKPWSLDLPAMPG
ncbi:hypothetical protein G7B40_001445 [Aetokthonos hydrillicola Thurmond2011]|uniref:Uncharacterized protein n=1 Tax=Aetokthonos hydrillicola Thurmond2011 TaxID=2712845 RepID=A0AAP5I694_9CYAN|nr:hypothetical protein [Aetokthonos hydrillicola]MBO3463129.1 hypothetical protein [Aetokthonos hydrillicola CCALA 1050]MBW4591087.1 hypothetical protein [Aetokthonos hydrillicola CCALA 1050]MDR9893250.1 hypothetical protein [Aetokthonos hydrillicola Thurmond2011]